MKTCSIESCDRPHYARSWCHMHYQRWRIHGDPKVSRTRRGGSIEQRFWSKVDKINGPLMPNQVERCWQWTGGILNSGYGYLNINGACVTAHRMAYELSTGNSLGHNEADHTCFNHACVNPAHLRSATRSENRQNLQGAYRNNKCGIRGVYQKNGKYRAYVGHTYLGTFTTKEEAGEIARNARLALFTHNDLDRQRG